MLSLLEKNKSFIKILPFWPYTGPAWWSIGFGNIVKVVWRHLNNYWNQSPPRCRSQFNPDKNVYSVHCRLKRKTIFSLYFWDLPLAEFELKKKIKIGSYLNLSNCKTTTHNLSTTLSGQCTMLSCSAGQPQLDLTDKRQQSNVLRWPAATRTS